MHRHARRVVVVAVVLGGRPVSLTASGAALGATKRPKHKKPHFSQSLTDYCAGRPLTGCR